MKAFMTIAYKCRLRPKEVRNLKNEHKLSEGLLCTRDKGSKNTIVEWDEELKETMYWSEIISPYIVHDGKGYLWKKNSFDSAWRRLMNLALKSGLKKKFTAHAGEIRTPDHLVRSQVLYPAELRAHYTSITG